MFIDDARTIDLAVQADGSHADVRAPTTDPASAYSDALAVALTPADPRTYIPATAATSTAAETADSAGAYGAAAASRATTDSAGAYARARPLAGATTSIPTTGATSSAAEIVNFAGASIRPDASPEITDRADTVGALAASAAPDPNGAPPAYAYQAGAAANVEDPAGGYSAASASAPMSDSAGACNGAGASAPTLAAADAHIAYSAAGATAPTIDQARTDSSPYALDRLFLTPNNLTPSDSVLSFSSAAGVANFYGANSKPAKLANEYFAGAKGAQAKMLFTRYPISGSRPHLIGGNLSSIILAQLQDINDSLTITFQGWTYTGQIDLSKVQSFAVATTKIMNALNSNLPVAAVTTASSITPMSVSFTGSLTGHTDGAEGTSGGLLTVNSVSSGRIYIGAQISGPGVASGAQIVAQDSGPPGGPGLYVLYENGGIVPTETLTESYGVLTVGSVSSGAIALGEQVTGAGVSPLTGIVDNLSGSGPGSTWLVNNAQTVAGENMTLTATPLSASYRAYVGATQNRDFFMVQPNGAFGFD